LRELFVLVRKSGNTQIRFNIETKIDPNHPDEAPDPQAFVAKLLGVIETEGFSDRVMVQSFDWRTLEVASAIAPDVPRVCLTAELKGLDTVQAGNASGSPWTAGLRGRVLRMPISHGEGNYYADPETHRRLVADDRVVFRYCDADGNVTRDANPNGSLDGIAGIRDERGNVLGLMPHPERACEAILGGEDGLLVLRALETRLARPLLSAVSDT
jgi:hypothetical protein